jgi:hypothetical protein
VAVANFGVIRRWFLGQDPQGGKVVADNLELILTTATDAGSTGTDNTALITALQAAVAQLQIDVVAAQAAAEEAPFLAPPFTAADVEQTTSTVGGPSDTAATTEAITGPAVCNVYSSTGAKLRNADATDLTKAVNCFVSGTFASGATATYYLPGQWITGLTLTPGATYWLATTPGQITTTPPTSGAGHGTQIIGTADSSGTKLWFAPQPLDGI